MTAEEAAVKLQKERGHIVIGYPPNSALLPMIGNRLYNFAGGALLHFDLVMIGETDRKDWDVQVHALFGTRVPKRAKHPVEDGQTFYACTLETAQ
jgi:hypothetical protein